jgi:hypothetical protein
MAGLVALGIGLHNLGEGLAIGFGLRHRRAGPRRLPRRRLRDPQHHRGLAIVLRSAAAARARPSAASLRSGCWPAAPPCSARGSAPRPSRRRSPPFLLGVGVGAIAQVIVQIAPGLRDAAGRVLDRAVAGGIAGGMLAM